MDRESGGSSVPVTASSPPAGLPISPSTGEIEHWFTQCFSSVGFALACMRSDGGWRWVNQNFAEILGFGPEELCSHNHWELTHPEDLVRSMDEFNRLRTGRITELHLDQRLRTRSGHYLWSRLTISPFNLFRDRTPLYLVHLENVENWKRSQRQLHLQALALDQIGDTVTVTDGEGKIAYVNRALERQLGYSREQLVGRSIDELGGDPVSTVPIRQVLQQVQKRGQYVREVIRHGADGQEKVMECRSNIIRDETSRLVGLCEVGTEITERRRLEEQLRQTHKMEAIGRLAGGISHDFNNILAAMMMQLELLLAETTPQQSAYQPLQELLADAKRAANLTRQLLHFSRRSSLSIQSTDLNELVTHLMSMLRRLVGEHIQIEFLSETGLPSAQGDRGMLEQVVMNLVLNARDAMPEGGRIQVETCSLQITAEYARQFQGRRPGQFVRLTVADNGCGMDAVTRQRIFEPFFTTKELGQGTGLGLATCYGIIQRHQGWMEVESTPGAGSRFHVFIPVAEGEPDTTPSMPKE